MMSPQILRRLSGLLVSCLAVMFAGGALTGPTSAAATAIDFDSLVGTGEVNRGCTYMEDGFTLDYASPCLPSGEFRSIHPPSFRFSSSVSFYNNSQLGVTRLTRTGGGTFALDSIDLDGLNFPVATTVTFTGTLLDATTVTQTFNTDALFPARQTFAFGASFDTVTQVTWVQVGGAPGPQLPFHQFDDIVVTANAQAVPGPSSSVLMSLGLALSLAGYAWRRRILHERVA